MTSKTQRDRGAGAFHLMDRMAGNNSPTADETEVTPKRKRGSRGRRVGSSATTKMEQTFLDPDSVVVWRLANRVFFDTDSIESLKESIRAGGQHQAALVRPIPEDNVHYADPSVEYELIYGAQRLRAVRELDERLLVEIRDVDDQQAALLMDAENRVRSDISVIERAYDYSRWLQEGLFENASAICRATGLSRTQISKLLKVAELPAAVAEAFSSPHDISLVFGYELARLVNKDQAKKDALIAAASKLSHTAGNKSMSARQRYLYASVTTAFNGQASEVTSSGVFDVPSMSVTDKHGRNAARITVSRSGELRLRTRKLSSESQAREAMRALNDALEMILAADNNSGK